MAKRRSKDKAFQKQIALNRINQLFSLAEEYALAGKMSFANRYVQLARRISMRYLVPIPKEWKRCFCKHCYRYLLSGVSGRVRINKGKLVMYCSHCKRYTRMPLHRQ